MQSKIPIYQKTFARDFSFGILQLWYVGECSGPRKWTHKKQPSFPYDVFHRTPKVVEVYSDPAGIAWVKKELMGLVEKNPKFVAFVSSEFENHIVGIKEIFEKEETLSIKELKKFTAKAKAAWPWFEAVWWLIDVFENNPAHENELRRLQQVRKFGEKFAPGTNAVIKNSIAKAFPRIKKYVNAILLEEVFSKKIPSKKVLESRLKNSFYAGDTLFVGVSKEFIEKKYGMQFESKKISKNITQFNGQTAFPGIVKGKVRIILSRAQIHTIKKGEILVSPSTTPDFMPAIAKASAIITDEGGIICHAAIIAREMKIPCVIGTKIATQVLNDGDAVEINANNGIVKILKKMN